ncbi:MAG: YraN family protein [Geobacter sp.]|nr:YraN family protein [Geobacter sp.]
MKRGGEKGASNQQVGEAGEELAVALLSAKGYRIVERNFRCKGGEVDIVARDGSTLVFVEVKTRRDLSYGPPQLAVTPFKQRQISKAALFWLARAKKPDAAARFDVVAITLLAGASPQVEHIVNAFDLAY